MLEPSAIILLLLQLFVGAGLVSPHLINPDSVGSVSVDVAQEGDDHSITKDSLLESSNQASQMMITLAAPSVNDDYYTEVFDQVLDFQIKYANTIYGNDQVRILVDQATLPLVKNRVPDEIITITEVADIWMRDFTTVNSYDPVMFAYEGEYFDNPVTPRLIQDTFFEYLETTDLSFRESNYVLDGGNVVDNYRGSIVVSERFLEENDLRYSEGKRVLRNEYGAEHVAIIPYDDEVMGHSDGMVMFVDDVLFVNQYDEPFRGQILDELENSLPNTIEIVEVKAYLQTDQWQDFSSACGVNVNSLVTENHIYIPVFGDTDTDRDFIETVRGHTNKIIHTIDASDVCFMGGSVRCLAWQVVQEQPLYRASFG